MGFIRKTLASRDNWALLALVTILFALLIGLSGSSDATVEDDYEYLSDGSNVTITGYTGTGGAITIPSTLGGKPVTTIDDSAFEGNAVITAVSIPSSVTALGEKVFENCTKLQTVIFLEGSTIASIPQGAFRGCTSLATINIPSTVTSIGKVFPGGAFEGCSSLVTISIPDAVTDMGVYTFRDCINLTSVTFTENSMLRNLGNSET